MQHRARPSAEMRACWIRFLFTFLFFSSSTEGLKLSLRSRYLFFSSRCCLSSSLVCSVKLRNSLVRLSKTRLIININYFWGYFCLRALPGWVEARVSEWVWHQLQSGRSGDLRRKRHVKYFGRWALADLAFEKALRPKSLYEPTLRPIDLRMKNKKTCYYKSQAKKHTRFWPFSLMFSCLFSTIIFTVKS